MIDLQDITDAPLPVLPTRHAKSHKGDFGRALLVGGSRGMSGAISMSGLATLRSGAGLVTLAVPTSIQDVVAAFSPCYMMHQLADDDGFIALSASESLREFAANATAVALGPGLGRKNNLTALVSQLYREIEQPMVVDADALFALAEYAKLLNETAGPRVLTPHPGEFQRLTGKLPTDAERVEAAAMLAQRDGKKQTIIVLKGHRTIVTDGQRFALNQTGNPGMATGGSGDVLTGVITALLCQGLSPFDAARLGAHVHGLAGDLAALDLGQVGLIATDIIDYLPQAFQTVGVGESD
jgi:ADP-dependent NAD(P)H-hydrate dehydratase